MPIAARIGKRVPHTKRIRRIKGIFSFCEVKRIPKGREKARLARKGEKRKERIAAREFLKDFNGIFIQVPVYNDPERSLYKKNPSPEYLQKPEVSRRGIF